MTRSINSGANMQNKGLTRLDCNVASCFKSSVPRLIISRVVSVRSRLRVRSAREPEVYNPAYGMHEHHLRSTTLTGLCELVQYPERSRVDRRT